MIVLLNMQFCRHAIHADRANSVDRFSTAEIKGCGDFFMQVGNPADKNGFQKAAKNRSLTTAVFQKLKSAIMAGQIEPGSKLIINPIAEKYGVSLSAVREALSRLVAEGFVEASDMRGFRVAAVSNEDLLDLTDARITIECLAAERSVARGDQAWEDRLRVSYENLVAARDGVLGMAERDYEFHKAFHEAVVSACGSNWLLYVRNVLFERAERYRLLSINYAKLRREVDEEHAAIYQAALARDAKKLTELLTNHVQQTTDVLLRKRQR
ncbi:FCD domain-containing protein [Sinorhizobium meliloti]|uniref:GntR family transcriptional regulator n=1 Tax=Rhizobium meliloti TaxID=382 RepID=UPI003F175D64